MGTGLIGLIDQPNQNKVPSVEEAHTAGAKWVADNGCFSDKWDEGKWWQFLVKNAHRVGTCLFAVAPDVVGDAAATYAKSGPWLPKIRALGYPVAYVAQDGAENHPPPWPDIDCLFLGGTDAFKLGQVARDLVAEAKRRGKWVHMGRVNSQRRFTYARLIGCDSVDGTYLTFGPNTNLPKLLRWVRSTDQGFIQ